MRLIDALELKRSISASVLSEDGKRIFDIIDEQPTIVERKMGKWIRITQGAIPEKYMCPFCHRTVEHEGVEQLVSIIYPFCHCGAKMVAKERVD